VRALTEDNYTIVPAMKTSVRRILRVRDHVKRTEKLMSWLDGQKISTQILYCLLTLAIASDHLALDKYAVFYVCRIVRSQRSTAVKKLDHLVDKYLIKAKSKILHSREKFLVESSTCPPLVKREYRPSDHVTKEYDLAVVYKDRISEIPRKWVYEYIEDRALARDTYQFTKHLAMPMAQAANALSRSSSNYNWLVNWAKEPREEIEARLRDILQCYAFDGSYQMICDDFLRSSIFSGLALYDLDHSQAFSFETETVDLSKFLLKQ